MSSTQSILANVLILDNLTINEGKNIFCGDNAIPSTSKVSGLDTALAGIVTNVTTLQTSNTALNTTISEITTNVTALQTDVTTINSNISALETADANFQTSLNTMNASILDLETADTNFQSSLNAMNSTITNLGLEDTAINTNVAQVSSDLSNLTTTVTTLTTDLNVAETNITTLQGNISTLESDIVTLEEANTNLQSTVSNLQTTVDGLSNDVGGGGGSGDDLLQMKAFVVSTSALNGANLFTSQNVSNLSLDNINHMSNMNFTAANLSFTNFSRSTLDNSDFTNADLSNVDFSDANLYGSTFTGSNITNTNFDGAIMFGVSGASYSLTTVALLEDGAYRNDNIAKISGDGNTFLLADFYYTKMSVYANVSNTWSQVGSNISLNDIAEAVINNDGSIIAGSDINQNSSRGQIFAYQNQGGTWTQLGSGTQMQGDFSTSRLGQSMAMSGDGFTIVAGANIYNSNTGYVKVFTWNSGLDQWDEKGSRIDGESTGDRFGSSVAMSEDGNTFIVGTIKDKVYAYNWSGSAWVQKGSTLTAPTINTYFGYTGIAISNDGNRIFVGDPRSDDGVGSRQGRVHVYDWDGSTWNLLQTISGPQADSDFGCKVEIRGNGHEVFVLAQRYNSQQGYYGVYGFNGTTFELIDSIFPSGVGKHPFPSYGFARNKSRIIYGDFSASKVTIQDITLTITT